MKRLLLLYFNSFLILNTFSLVGQSNSFDFDGIDDFVGVTNASSFISTDTAMAISCWVYPTNSNAGWPDFDGFLGFRNDINADFYILQLNSTTVEARFRNSLGTNFDISQSGLTLNTWQHFIFTYNGTTLSLYLNGVLGTSIPANGNINNTAVNLNIGKVKFGISDFYFDGKIDDVGLWSKNLTASEVACIYAQGINPADTKLQLYYDFNQGVAGGTNTSVSTVIDRMNNTNGQLTGAALTGTSSNWLTGVASHTQISASICNGSTYAFGSQTLDSAGVYYNTIPLSGGCDSIVELTLSLQPSINITDTIAACDYYMWINGITYYTSNNSAIHTIQNTAGCDTIVALNLTMGLSNTATDAITVCDSLTWIDGITYSANNSTATHTLQNSAGCDSLVTLNLIIDPLDLTVTNNSPSITANAIGATYQWLDCFDYSKIVGETNRTFTATNNGSYAVEVTKNGCTDTSACIIISSVGLTENVFKTVNISPNPSNGKFILDLGELDHPSITIHSVEGKLVYNKEFVNESNLIIELIEMPGIYFVTIETKANKITSKIVVK
jgi:hypothetical protein